MNDIDALMAWLLEAPRGCPVEEGGATAAFAAISGKPVNAVLQSQGLRELTQREQQQLQTLGVTTGHERRGVLYAGTLPVAATTAVLLTHRIPAAALRAIGLGSREGASPGAELPLGRALAGFGVWREPLEVLPTPGQRDASGKEQVIWSSARLWLGCPIAIVTERVYGDFLTVYPGPWAAR